MEFARLLAGFRAFRVILNGMLWLLKLFGALLLGLCSVGILRLFGLWPIAWPVALVAPMIGFAFPRIYTSLARALHIEEGRVSWLTLAKLLGIYMFLLMLTVGFGAFSKPAPVTRFEFVHPIILTLAHVVLTTVMRRQNQKLAEQFEEDTAVTG